MIDFRGGERGKYAARYHRRLKVRNPNIGVVVFSLIETVTNAVALILWLQQIDGGLFTPNKVQAYIVWIVGFIIEHVVAFNVAKKRPWFSFPLKP